MKFFVAMTLALSLSGACASTSAHQGSSTGPTDPLKDVGGSELFEEGKRQAQAGDLVRAEQYLVAAMDKGQPSAEVLPVLIQVCIAGSRFDTALHHARPHLIREPENHSLRYMVATLYNAVGRKALAVEHLERVLLDAPTQANARYTLGRIMWQEKDEERAAVLMQEYLDLEPEGSHAPDARALLVQWKRRIPTTKVKNVAPPIDSEAKTRTESEQ